MAIINIVKNVLMNWKMWYSFFVKTECDMNEPYRVLLEGKSAEVELKKSRFIANVSKAETVEEAEEFINKIKKQYYDARHNCYAYVIGKDASQVKYSDDGEPSQTGGMPIYNILKESGVRNAVIVVTRYFGGTLLGTGPLARMYSDAANEGLKASLTGWMKYGVTFVVRCDYSEGEKVRRYLEKEGIVIDNIQYSASVEVFGRTGFEDFERVEKDIVSLTASKAEIEKTGEGYFLEKKQ